MWWTAQAVKVKWHPWTFSTQSSRPWTIAVIGNPNLQINQSAVLLCVINQIAVAQCSVWDHDDPIVHGLELCVEKRAYDPG